MISLGAFLVVIGVCVVVHEMGHYISAKKCGVLVYEFSFGMGTEVFSRTRGETKWSLRLFPIGGFVKLAGSGELDDVPCPPERTFNAKTPWQKAVVLAAGSFANIALAWILTLMLLMGHGVVDLGTATVGEIMDGYPAKAAGLMPGDVITQIGDKKITGWQNMSDTIKTLPEAGVDITVRRGGSEIMLRADIKKDVQEGRPLLGVRPGWRQMGFFEASGKSLRYTWDMGIAILQGLYQWATGAVKAEVSGPVGIATMAGDAARRGFWEFISFTAVLSLNLGLMNLLPFPALDGGRLVFVAAEGITRRRVPEKIENALHYAGFALLMALILFVTWKDIARLLAQ